MAGWTVAVILLWLCWSVAAPLVARPSTITYHQICPMIQVKHGIGSDLKTFRRESDFCGDIP